MFVHVDLAATISSTEPMNQTLDAELFQKLESSGLPLEIQSIIAKRWFYFSYLS
jgi:hypothetical protein